MLLTQQELIDLTDYQVPARQIKWLTEHGWSFEIGASGRPKVSRAYAEQKMGAAHSIVEPDFSFLTKAA